MRGEELPKARQVWPHNERYSFDQAGWKSHTLEKSHSSCVSLNLTDPDRFEGLPIVGQGEEIIFFAIRRLRA